MHCISCRDRQDSGVFAFMSLGLVLVRVIAIQPDSVTPPRFSGHTDGPQTVGVGAPNEVRKAGQVVDPAIYRCHLQTYMSAVMLKLRNVLHQWCLCRQFVMLVLGKDGSLKVCT